LGSSRVPCPQPRTGPLHEQFIPTNAHRHMSIVFFFINSLPQYVFRRAYIAIFRGSLKFSNIDQYL
jgi:hypothetical protein